MRIQSSTNRRLQRARLLSGCALSLVMLPAVAFAQEAVELNEVVVTTASGKATSVQDAPASITVIGAEEIAATGARDLKDLLRTVPGLSLTQGNNGNASVSFRGMSSGRTLTLVDGKRQNARNTFPRNFQGDLQVVPVDAIERIEVVRGPMSTLYGSDAMGGVINIITKKSDTTWSGSITAESSFADSSTTADSRSLSGYISGPVAKNLTFSGYAKHSKLENAETPYKITTSTNATTGVVTNTPVYASNASTTKTIGGRLNWTPTDAHEFGLELQTNEDDYLGKPEAPGTTNEVKRDSIALTHEWSLGSGELSSFLRYEDSSNTSATAVDPISYETLSAETRYVNSTQVGNMFLDYTLGATVSKEELVDPNTTAGRMIAGESTASALYAEGRLRFSDALTLTAGLRVDDHDRYGVNTTPRLYANYDFGNGLTLKAGYAQAFVAPDLRNLNPNYSMTSRGNGCKPYVGPCDITGNPNLKPETSDNYEIGLNFQGATRSWEVTAFYNDVTDMISARRIQAATATQDAIFQRDNFDYGKTAGVEFGYSQQFGDAITWTTSGTWIAKSEFKYGDFATAYPMATTPEWTIGTGVTYQANDALKLSAQVNYVGKQAGFILDQDVNLGTGEQPSVPAGQNAKAYYLVNVAAAYDLNDSSTLNVGIDNLFDSQPQSDADYRENGRLFKVGLTTRF